MCSSDLPEHAVLISADALWNNGFGVVFPELTGKPGFDAVGETLALIESLKPRVVIPGHGPTFSDVPGALERAQRRLAQFRADPARHSQYAAKALLKFKLLETQSMPTTKLRAWMQGTSIMRQIHARHPRGLSFGAWTEQVISDLLQSGAARATNGALHNT